MFYPGPLEPCIAAPTLCKESSPAMPIGPLTKGTGTATRAADASGNRNFVDSPWADLGFRHLRHATAIFRRGGRLCRWRNATSVSPITISLCAWMPENPSRPWRVTKLRFATGVGGSRSCARASSRVQSALLANDSLHSVGCRYTGLEWSRINIIIKEDKPSKSAACLVDLLRDPRHSHCLRNQSCYWRW